MRALALAAAVFLLVPVASAHAAARTRSAQAFADVMLQAQRSIDARADDLAREYREREPRCEELMRSAPDRLALDVIKLWFAAVYQPRSDLIIDVSRQIVAGLDAVRTRDPVLRSGRAGWRTGLRLSEELPRVDDLCAALAQWRDAGWSKRATPPYLLFDEEAQADRSDAVRRRLRAAARRLRMLGVPPAAARRFTGDRLLDGLPEPPFTT